MTTALDIIQDSFERIGVYAAGETVASADAARALAVLNDLLDSWSNESLICYAVSEQTATLTPGVSQYLIGTQPVLAGNAGNYIVASTGNYITDSAMGNYAPAGAVTWTLTRPLRILDAPGRAYLQDANQNNYPLQVVERDQWNLIGTRNIQADIPDTLFYDPQYPLGIINVFPIPTVGYQMFWDSYLPLQEFASLAQQMNLPAGYAMALKTNLAAELWPFFKAGDVPPPTQRAAMKSLAAVKRTNMRPLRALIDGGMGGDSEGRYNIYSDSLRI